MSSTSTCFAPASKASASALAFSESDCCAVFAKIDVRLPASAKFPGTIVAPDADAPTHTIAAQKDITPALIAAAAPAELRDSNAPENAPCSILRLPIAFVGRLLADDIAVCA